jgi:hypothetical protein
MPLGEEHDRCSLANFVAHPITVSGTIRVPANERITRFRWPHFHASVRRQCVGGLLTHYDRPA